MEGRVRRGKRACVHATVAMMSATVATPCVAKGEWPDGPLKEWFENLQRPDDDLLLPQRRRRKGSDR